MDIWEINKELGLKKYVTESCKNGYGYKGVISTGRFEGLEDYDTGLVTVSILNPHRLDLPIVSITTIDDGSWSGYGKHEISLDVIVNDFKVNFGVKLPTEQDLNDFLSKYDVYGHNTG